MYKVLSILIIYFNILVCWGQIYIDNSIELSNTNASSRQIKNLGDVYDSTNITSAGDVQNNNLIFIEASGTDSIYGATQFDYVPYIAGTALIVKIDSNNSSSVTININGYGEKNILKNVSDTLITNDLLAGQLIYLIYDGVNFQMINSIEKFCPSGFIEVNKSYCIQQDENPAQNLWNAVLNCKNKGAKLCTWHEWYYACQKSSLSLSNMTNNFEWLNCPVNNPNQSGVMGDGDCVTGSANAATTLRNFRCCYAR